MSFAAKSSFAEGGSAVAAAAAVKTPVGGVRWDKVIFPLGTQQDGLDCEPLVAAAFGGAQGSGPQSQYQAAGQPWFCDEEVPREMVRSALEAANDAQNSAQNWVRTEVETLEFDPTFSGYRPPPARRFQWRSYSEAGADAHRLLYVECECACFTALEVVHHGRRAGLVTGESNAHPFAHAPNFFYCNSDGSTDCRPLGEQVGPDNVLAKLIHDFVLHCGNSEH